MGRGDDYGTCRERPGTYKILNPANATEKREGGQSQMQSAEEPRGQTKFNAVGGKKTISR